MAFGKKAPSHERLPSQPPEPKPKPRKTHWVRGAVMSFGVAAANLIFFAYTGESLPSPTYGALTRHGHEPNPGGAWLLTGVLTAFGVFCLAMHRRQRRKEKEPKKRS